MPDLDLPTRPEGSPELRGYLARPEGNGPWPGVVLLHEMFGVDDTIRGLADRLAEAGYLVVAPNLFTGGAKAFADTCASIVSGKGRAVEDVLAARNRLAGDQDCTGRIGIMGLSMGGSVALRMLGKGFDAASVAYPVQLFSLDDVLEGACPVVASFGGTDPAAPKAAKRFEQALTERDIPHDVQHYAGAGHSYLNTTMDRAKPLRPLLRLLHQGPNATAGEDTLVRTEKFFAEHLR